MHLTQLDPSSPVFQKSTKNPNISKMPENIFTLFSTYCTALRENALLLRRAFVTPPLSKPAFCLTK